MQLLFFLGLTVILGIPVHGFVNRYGRFPAAANKSVAMGRKFKLSKSFSRDDIQLTAVRKTLRTIKWKLFYRRMIYVFSVAAINSKEGIPGGSA